MYIWELHYYTTESIPWFRSWMKGLFLTNMEKFPYVIRRLKIIGWNRLTKTLQMLLRIFPPKNISVKYLQEPGFLLFTELFLQNVPQPVHYSVVAMVTTVISCVTSVGRKTNKLAKMQWYNKMNVWARYPWRHQTEDCKIIPRMYRMHTT